MAATTDWKQCRMHGAYSIGFGSCPMCQAHGLSLLEPFVPIDTGEIHRAGVHAQYQDTVATLISRVQALEGALRFYTSKHPSNFVGGFHVPCRCEHCVMLEASNTPAGESVRTDRQRVEWMERNSASVNCNFCEPGWSCYPDVLYKPDLEAHGRTLRDAVDAAMDLTTTETTNDHDEG